MISRSSYSLSSVSRYLLLCCCFLSGTTRVWAQYTWTGAAGTNWSTAGNWTGGVPVSGQNTSITFGATSQSFASNDIATNPFLLNSLTVNSAAPASWLIIGNPLSFRTSTTSVLPSLTVASGKNLSVRNALVLTNNTTFNIGANSFFSLDGNTSTAIISGAGQLIKTGSGTIGLGNNTAGNLNSFTGSAVIQEGTIQIDTIANAGVNSSIGAGSSITLGGATTTGTLQFDNNGVGDSNRSFNIAAGGGVISFGSSSSSTFSGQFSGTGKLTVTNNASSNQGLTLTNDNSTFTGQIEVNNGIKLVAQNANALGSGSAGVLLNRGTLELTGVNITGKTLTMNSVGTGSLLSTTSSSGASVWAGDIVLNSGTHSIFNSGTSLTLSGTISGVGGFNMNGAVILSGANTFTGATTSTSSTQLRNNLALQNSTVSGSVNFDTTTAPVFGGLAGSGTLNLGSRSFTFGGNNAATAYTGSLSGTSTISKVGGGDFTLGGSISGAGISFNNSRLILDTAASISGPLNLDGTQIRLLSARTLSNSITVGNSGWRPELNGFDMTVSGAISGTGGMTMSGPGTLTLSNAANNYAGATTVNSGALRLTAAALPTGTALTVASGASVDLNGFSTTVSSLSGGGNVALGTGNLTINGSTSTTHSGAISGFGGIVKSGTSTLTLSGLNTYSGATTVNGGRLVLANLSNSSGYTVNSGGTLELANSNINLGSGSLRANAGGTIEYNGANVTGGFLRGPGTHNITAASSFDGTTALNGTVISQNVATTLTNFTSGGDLTNNAALTWDGGTLTSAGRMTVNSTANVIAFESAGRIVVNSGGVLNNSGTDLVLGGGSTTFIGTQAVNGGRIDLGGQSLLLRGGLLVNNGGNSASGNGVRNGTTVVDFGGVAKGDGYYSSIVTQNGGVYSPGNSPGHGEIGSFVMNSGGALLIEMNDAMGIAGPTAGFTRGWDMVSVDTLNLSATTADKFLISLRSLLGPSGDTFGLADNFDSGMNYSWKIIDVTGTTNGVFDPLAFKIDSSNFLNSTNGGQFSLSSLGGGIFLNFTPIVTAVPEPSTAVTVSVLFGLLLLRRNRKILG